MPLTDDRVLQDMLVLEDIQRRRQQDHQEYVQSEQQRMAFAERLEQAKRASMRPNRAAEQSAQTFGSSRGAGQQQFGAEQILNRANAALASQAGGTGAAYAEDAQEDLAQIAPLVRQGVLGAKDVQAVVKSAAMGGIVDQRNNRKAQRVMQAIQQQTENGTFNESQTAGAILSAEKEFPQDVLLQVPGYVQMKGLQEQMKTARELTKFEAAEQLGVDPNVLGFDEDGELILDEKKAGIKQYQIKVDEAETEKAAKITEAKRKNIETQVNAITAQIRSTNTLLAATKDPAYLNALNRLTVQQHKLLRELGGTGKSVTEESPSKPAAKPKASYTRDSLQAATRSGTIKNGDEYLLDGVPAVHVNGKPKRL